MIIHDVTQGTPEWFKLRAGKPTSSNFGSLVSGLGKPSKSLEEYAHILAVEKYLDGPIEDGWGGNKFTDRGKEMEAEAKADYEMENQVTVQEVGFITDDLMRWGSSTDGLVGDDGVIEIKNMIATRFAKLKIYWNKHNKIPPEYIPQIQGEIFVSGRSWCDWMAYHPQFEPIIVRHFSDAAFHAVLETQLMAVMAERNNILKLIK